MKPEIQQCQEHPLNQDLLVGLGLPLFHPSQEGHLDLETQILPFLLFVQMVQVVPVILVDLELPFYQDYLAHPFLLEALVLL